MIKNHIIDFIKFRRGEILILLALVLLGGCAYGIMEFTTANFWWPRDFQFLLLAYIFFIFEEHKHQIILNKDTNKFIIIEKALAQNFHKIRNQVDLDNVEKVTIHSYKPLLINIFSKRRIEKFQLHIHYKEEIRKEILKFSTFDHIAIKNMEKQINDFLLNNEKSLVLTSAPYLFRRMGYVFIGIFIFLFFLNYTA